MMFIQTKEQYAPPRSEELDVQLEGVVAASPGEYPGIGGEESI